METKLNPRQSPQKPPKPDMKSNQVIFGDLSNSEEDSCCIKLSADNATYRTLLSLQRRYSQWQYLFHRHCTTPHPEKQFEIAAGDSFSATFKFKIVNLSQLSRFWTKFHCHQPDCWHTSTSMNSPMVSMYSRRVYICLWHFILIFSLLPPPQYLYLEGVQPSWAPEAHPPKMFYCPTIQFRGAGT